MSKFTEECWFQAEEWANARAAERNYNTLAGAQLEIDEGAKLGKLFEELEAARARGQLVQDVIRAQRELSGWLPKRFDERHGLGNRKEKAAFVSRLKELRFACSEAARKLAEFRP